MPYLYLVVNVQVEDSKTLIAEITELAAKTLNKPKSYVSAVCTYNETLSFAGTFEPAYNLQITSLGSFDTSEGNVAVSKTFADYIQKKFGISPTRGYIALADPGRDRMGYGGSTIGALMPE